MPLITRSKHAKIAAAKGLGRLTKFDADTLRRVREAKPGDVLHLSYIVHVDSTPFSASMKVETSDPHGLFEGSTILDMLTTLIAQVVEDRLS